MVATAEQPRPSPHDIAVLLADEGVPVRAIARSVRIPGEDVYEILKTAVAEGRLIEIPRDDWPVGGRRERSPAERVVLALDDTMLQMTCSSLFKLTRLQAAVFATIIRRPSVTKEQLHRAIENNRDANQEPTDQKMVDVVICHIRKKIKAYALTVETVWGVGYSMKLATRDRALELIEAFMKASGV